MTLTTATEILDHSLTIRPSIRNTDFDNAVKLAIEAIKFRQQEEKRTPYLAYAPLPGETKE